jgi:hypothetical protein
MGLMTQAERSRKYRLAHPERVKEARREYHATHREERNYQSLKYREKHLEERRAKDRKCKARDPKKHSADARAWNLANPTAFAAANKRYRQRNPEKVNAWVRNRKANKRKAKGSFTGEQFISLKREHGNQCLCCGRSEFLLNVLGLKLVPDHVVSLANGGANDINNIKPLCHGKGGCNNRKGRRHEDYRGKLNGNTN